MKQSKLKSDISFFEIWKTEAHKMIKQPTDQKREFDLLQNKKFLELIEHSPTVVLVVNHLTSKYEYCSKNAKMLLGYTSEELINGGVPFGLSLIEESHAAIFQKFIVHEMFENLEFYKKNDEIKKIRLSYNFKTTRKDGTNIWVLQHMSVIETDETGGATVCIVFMTDVSHMKKNEEIDFSVSKLDESGCFQPIYTTTFPSNEIKFEFTKRELDIIELINKGHTSESIAESLCISKHTVDTHRKNIFQKLRVRNRKALLNTLKLKGLIE